MASTGVHPKTTNGQPAIGDERVKALWNEGVQLMWQKGYT